MKTLYSKANNYFNQRQKRDKILLIALADTGRQIVIGGKTRKAIRNRPIIGLLYLSSAAKSMGVEAEILDQHATPFSLEYIKNKILSEKYLFVGFHAPVVREDCDSSAEAEYASSIKKNIPDLTLIAGGPGTYYPKHFLNNGFDIVARGEGEETIKDLIRYARGKLDLNEIDGITYNSTEGTVSTPGRKLIENIGSISHPDWEKIDFNLYKDDMMPTLKNPAAPLIASRGCPLRCAFCYSPDFWKHSFRVRPVSELLEEVDVLVNKYGIRYILFQDDIFGWDNDWLEDFCEKLVLRKYRNLKWMCHLHPLSFKNEQERMIKKMRLAGCNLFHLGMQSSDPGILKNINRSPEEIVQLRKIIQIASKNRIMTAVDFIIGLPGETRKTALHNLHYALSAKPDLISINPLHLEAGTDLFDNKKAKKENLSDNEKSRLSLSINRRFYMNPVTVFRISKKITYNNPCFFMRLLNRVKMIY